MLEKSRVDVKIIHVPLRVALDSLLLSLVVLTHISFSSIHTNHSSRETSHSGGKYVHGIITASAFDTNHHVE